MLPKHVKARAAQDEREERAVRKLARSHHAPADWIWHAWWWKAGRARSLIRLRRICIAIPRPSALCSSLVVKVDTDYTSKPCPMCGVIDKKSRPNNVLLFICQKRNCEYRLHAGRPYILHTDLVGARNIAMRTLCTWQDWVQTGVLLVRPEPRGSNVSNSGTKEARLKRYAELRWI